VRFVNDSVREECAGGDKQGRHPPVSKMSGVPGNSEPEKREHREYAGLGCDHKVTEGRFAKLSLHHKQETGCARFNYFVSAKRETELVFPVYDGFSIYTRFF
jgi:hypothetical protein